jgi:hypothetical protein
MRLCALCGTPNPVEDTICSHHITTEASWAVANRVFCDLLHRRIEPAPVLVEVGSPNEALELVFGG